MPFFRRGTNEGMNVVRSKNHDIYSMTMNKIALSANDDKRKVKKDRIHTLALR